MMSLLNIFENGHAQPLLLCQGFNFYWPPSGAVATDTLDNYI